MSSSKSRSIQRQQLTMGKKQSQYRWQKTNILDDDSNSTHTMLSDVFLNLSNESLTDFLLVSNDGVSVPTSRFILGARSTVFREMLFGKGVVARSDELQVNYTGSVVQALVEFCRSDDISSFVQSLRGKDANVVRKLVHLLNCAEQYQLGGLESKVCDVTTKFLGKSCNLYKGCAIFDEASKLGPTAMQLKRIALKAIQSYPEKTLLNEEDSHLTLNDDNEISATKPTGVSFLGPRPFKEILLNKNMCCEEITMFRAIWLWADSRSGNGMVDLDRRELAKEYIRDCIDLSKCGLSNLMSIVTESDLVEQQTVWNAMSDIALRMEKEKIVPLPVPRNATSPTQLSSNKRDDHCPTSTRRDELAELLVPTEITLDKGRPPEERKTAHPTTTKHHYKMHETVPGQAMLSDASMSSSSESTLAASNTSNKSPGAAKTDDGMMYQNQAQVPGKRHVSTLPILDKYASYADKRGNKVSAQQARIAQQLHMEGNPIYFSPPRRQQQPHAYSTGIQIPRKNRSKGTSSNEKIGILGIAEKLTAMCTGTNYQDTPAYEYATEYYV